MGNAGQDIARLLLRATLGVLVLLHGIAKMRGGLHGIERLVEANGLPGELAYGVLVGEVIAPLMLVAGFHARAGGVLVAINMLFAIGLARMGAVGRLGAQGGWALELEAMFLVAAIAVALLGAGRWAVNDR
jgi:putative oxidoreductase